MDVVGAVKGRNIFVTGGIGFIGEAISMKHTTKSFLSLHVVVHPMIKCSLEWSMTFRAWIACMLCKLLDQVYASRPNRSRPYPTIERTVYLAGSHTVLCLLEHGYYVVIIDNLDNAFQEAYRWPSSTMNCSAQC